MSTKVSIIIPCYNNESTVLETLDAVYNQSFANIEVILVNDGSSDHSETVIASFLKKRPDLIYLKQENQGPSAARNFGSSVATGEFLVFLDADDKIHPDYIALCVDEFNADPTLDLVYSNSEFFENQTGIYYLYDYNPVTLLGQNCFPIVAMIRLKSFIDIGKFDVQLNIAEDWEMWIRYTSKFPKVKKIEQTLFFYRKRSSKDSISDLNKNENIIDDAHLYIYQKHYNLYKGMGWHIINLLSSRLEYLKYKDKYYNEWFRRFFYWLRGKKRS